MAIKTRKKRKKVLGSYPSFTVMISIMMSIFVIGLFGLILIHAQKLTANVKENIEVSIFLNNEISDSSKVALENNLLSKRYILIKNGKKAVEYISKEKAKQEFVEAYGEDFTKVLNDNPLPMSYRINIDAKYADSVNLRQIVSEIEQNADVKEVFYHEALINKINKNIQTITFVLGAFALILIVVSILFINNTIRLALYSQRFLIRSMQLVGATKWFIQRPFLWRAIVYGMFSAAIAVFILNLILNVGYQYFIELQELYQQNLIYSLYTILIIIGMMLGLVSSYISINKYLKMSLDELI